ncbi:MAG: DUF86 domain-containing protein [Flavonifractor plautii]
MLSRDLQRVLKIRDYCLSIQDTMSRFGVSLEGFLSDSDYQQSIAFSVLQIGELTSGLSEEYRSATKEQIQWPHIRGLRNIIVHDYGKIQLDQVWQIITEDIPVLKTFCNEQLPPEPSRWGDASCGSPISMHRDCHINTPSAVDRRLVFLLMIS